MNDWLDLSPSIVLYYTKAFSKGGDPTAINAINVPTKRPDVDAHITISRKAGRSTVNLQGYAVQHGTQTRVDGSKTLPRRGVPDNPAEIDLAKRSLVDSILSALHHPVQARQQSAHSSNGLDENNAMVISFRKLEKADPKDWTKKWRSTVAKRWLTYFGINILPRLQDYLNQPFTDQDRYDLRQAIIQDITNNGNSHTGKSSVINTANSNLAAAQKIYDAMRGVDPTLPIIVLSLGNRLKLIRPEQVKALSDSVRQQFAEFLQTAAASDPKHALCAVLMFAGAFRTAEAAGVDPWTDITFTDFGCTVTILFQEKDGARCPTLKTNNAYRTVVIPAGPTSVIRSCLGHLTRPNNSEPLLRADDLSAWVRNNLSAFISNHTLFWYVASTVAYLDPHKDAVDNNEVTAYVLRRDCASRWRNKCGLTQDEIDYLMGHESSKSITAKPDYRLPSNQALLAAKMERDVLFPSGSHHPALTPISLCANQDVSYIAYDKFRLVNDGSEELMLTLTVHAEEAGSTISVSCDTGVTIQQVNKVSKNTRGIRENKPAIGS